MNTFFASLFPADSGRAENIGYLLLLTWAAALPFPWGGVTPIGGLLLAVVAALLLALSSSAPAGRPGSSAAPLAGLFALALLGAIQLLPIPEEALRAISPGSLRSYHAAAEVLALFGRPDAPKPRVSVAPQETAGVILLTVSFGVLAICSARLLRNRPRRRLLAAVLVCAMAVEALLGAASLTPDGRLHGPFVNPNHFGGFLGVGFAVAFGLIWAELLTGRDRERGVGGVEDRFERRFLPLAARLAVLAVIALAIGLTKSRGAILAAGVCALALPGLGLFHGRVRSRRRRLAVAAVLTLVVSLSVVVVTAGREPLTRFMQSDPGELRADARLTLWKASLDAWRAYPILGSGLGTFREAFRSAQPRELEGQVEQAHNDFLQILVTGGVVGAALAVFTVGATLILLLRAWWRQMHREESAFILGALGALLFVLLHGIVEFDMSIPAIPATLAVVVGGAWAAGRAR